MLLYLQIFLITHRNTQPLLSQENGTLLYFHRLRGNKIRRQHWVNTVLYGYAQSQFYLYWQVTVITWWARQIRSRSCLCRNLATTSEPKVNETPLSFSPQPKTSLSGSDQSKSHSRPWSGTSVGRMMRLICSMDWRSGDSPEQNSSKSTNKVFMRSLPMPVDKLQRPLLQNKWKWQTS